MAFPFTTLNLHSVEKTDTKGMLCPLEKWEGVLLGYKAMSINGCHITSPLETSHVANSSDKPQNKHHNNFLAHYLLSPSPSFDYS